jgi:hypothetical protein
MCALLSWLNGPKGNRLRPVNGPQLDISTIGRSLFPLAKNPSGNGRQRGGVLLIPGLNATIRDKLGAATLLNERGLK